MNKKKRLKLIREVLRAAYEASDTWREDHFGAYLAYLALAIADNLPPSMCLYREQKDDVKFLLWLQSLFASNHAVWCFVEIIEQETPIDC